MAKNISKIIFLILIYRINATIRYTSNINSVIHTVDYFFEVSQPLVTNIRFTSLTIV